MRAKHDAEQRIDHDAEPRIESPLSPTSSSSTSSSLSSQATADAMALERRVLRRAMRARRRALASGRQRHAAQRLARHLVRQPWYAQARSLALYIAADGEIDPHPAMLAALNDGKRIFLPQLLPGDRLAFREYRPGARLRRNRFGIPEPWRGRLLSPLQLDVVLLPLVAFDRRGNRLGMGGGFYDRTLAEARQRGRWRANAPRLVGLAHGFQQVESLESRSWDVPLSGVLTERGWVAAR